MYRALEHYTLHIQDTEDSVFIDRTLMTMCFIDRIPRTQFS